MNQYDYDPPQKPKSGSDLFGGYKMPTPKKSKLRGPRDELVEQFVRGINQERLGTKWKPITAKAVAIRINANPHFKGRDGEVHLLLKECEKRGTFKKFFWACPLPNSKIKK